MSNTHAMGMADPPIAIPDDNPTSSPLAKLSAATRALEQASTLEEMKHIIDIAEAARTYARAAKLGLEASNHAAILKARAERKAGEYLRKLERAPVGRPEKFAQPAQISEYNEVLSDNDLSRRTADRWETVSTVPEDVFEELIVETVNAADKEFTTAMVLRKAQELKRQQHAASMAAAPQLPTGKYRIIYADPPWKYNNSGVITESDNYGRAARHYPTMSISELCAMGDTVKDMAEDDAVLFMWVTSPLLEECFNVIRSWGFQYKTSFVWDKIAHNFGHYNSVRHELLLICTRGSCTPDAPTLYDSVVSIQRGDHSEKPEEFRRIIDDLYTYGQRVELFARRAADGWDTWGNQA